MRQTIQWQRILILIFLSVTVVTPILFLPQRIVNFSARNEKKEFLEDSSSIKHTRDTPKLSIISQEIDEGLKEPARVVYKDKEHNSVVNGNSSDKNDVFKEKDEVRGRDKLVATNDASSTDTHNKEENQTQNIAIPSRGKGQSNQETSRIEPGRHSQLLKVTTEKIGKMEEQLITAKGYLDYVPPNSNAHLERDLKQRLKEVEQTLGEATKESYMPRSSVQRVKSMEVALSRAAQIHSDCSPTAMKFRVMTRNVEEEVEEQKNQATFLNQLAARTLPKGLHCLSMRLTAQYYSLQPKEREFPNRQKLQQPDLYHFAVFSDNVLACAVVVNSTVSTSMEPEKAVFHVVTDAQHLPAITMWFLANPPGEATVEVECMDHFKWLHSNINSILKKSNSDDPQNISILNRLRFYLPEVFPALDKIVLLDHDVVVQRDLRGLWSIDMKGNVNAAVETCGNTKTSKRMGMFLNFSDPIIAKRFDINACTWAFGMNVIDLREWRKQDLTSIYHKWLKLGNGKHLWKDGSLPLSLVVFYDLTVALDRWWHIHGLGYNSGVGKEDIEIAAVIHYDGSMKPWLEIAIRKYKHYWKKYLQYDHPYLQGCNIHE